MNRPLLIEQKKSANKRQEKIIFKILCKSGTFKSGAGTFVKFVRKTVTANQNLHVHLSI